MCQRQKDIFSKVVEGRVTGSGRSEVDAHCLRIQRRVRCENRDIFEALVVALRGISTRHEGGSLHPPLVTSIP